MLRVAREIAGSATPMLGVNIGGLGFLTAVPSDELAEALKIVWRGEFKYESRALIEASGRCNGQTDSRNGAERHRRQPRRGFAAHRAGRERGRRTHHALPLRRTDHQFADRFDGLFAGGGRRGGFADGGSVCADADLPARAFQPLHHFAAVLDHLRQGHQSAARDDFERGRPGRWPNWMPAMKSPSAAAAAPSG